MAKYKHIIWSDDNKSNDGKTWAHVRYLVGYCPQTIPSFKKMICEVQNTFPQIDQDEFECGQVHKSPYCNQFTIVAWNGYLEKKEYPGWTDITNGGQLKEYWW